MADKFVHKAGKGSMLTNLKKQKDSQPDFNGELRLSRSYNEGDTIIFAAWKRETARGMMFTLNEDTYRFNQIQEKKPQYPREINSVDDMDDDVPF